MKKGFTIIEVLAVIVVITLLTVLIVPNIINMTSSKRARISDASKRIIYDATDIYVKTNKVSFPVAEGATYCVKLETLVNNGNLVAPIKDLTSDKEIPLNYYVELTVDNYEQFNYNLSEECTVENGIIDLTPPTVANVTLKSITSNSITVVANGVDLESGISYYQFSKDNGTTWSKVQAGNEYTFRNLTTGTYKIKARVINGTYDKSGLNSKNYKDSNFNEITTGTIDKPTYNIDKTGWQSSKNVIILYPEGYKNEYSVDGGKTWYLYTTAVRFEKNGSIIARVTDGTNYVAGSNYTVSEIDDTNPDLELETVTSTTTSLSISITTNKDDETDISGTICKIASPSVINGTISNNTCTITGLSQGTNYSYEVVTTNGVGLTTKKTGSVTTQAIATFDGNNGTNGQSITKNVGSALGTLPTSTRTGYTFAGWYTSASGGNRIDENTEMPLGGVTYYAHWTINSYDLTVSNQKSSYGSISGSSTGSYNYNSSITVTATPKTGYVFSGWVENDKTVSTSSTYTFNMPAKNVSLTATYSFDIATISEIKVLNVYPLDDQSTTFQGWMNSYGQGKIKVTPVSIENFSSNPTSYLGTTNNWNYHVVVFGFRDCNQSKDISSSAATLIRQFINEGHGVIFGHDTITAQGCGDHTNFNSLASLVNLSVGSRNYNAVTTVIIQKTGIFTTYPYNIGTVGTNLTIPTSHVYGQTANGDIWLKFVGDTVSDNQNFYLTTWKNTAMIQTGHSNGTATVDEQKILANIIFYLYSYDLMNR